jgi:uncharacterized cysteine cluster protein YcgN (CxxCxxCC family)
MIDLCKKCGECCFKHFYGEGKVLKTKEKCKHLTKENLCSIYDNRPEWCLTGEQMKNLNLLPHNCGYQRS